MAETTIFYLIAGEASGDLLGARLMRALYKLCDGKVRFIGIGGPRMRQAGIELLFPQEELAHMGLIELIRHIPRILRRICETVNSVRQVRPHALITIDAPDFCFRVAKRITKTGIPIIHCVAPTVWAWRPGRAKKIAKFLTHLLVLLPFEPPYFTQEGLEATFVGHPIVESSVEQGNAARFFDRHGIDSKTNLISVLPGSRMGEASRLMPVFADTIGLVKERFPDLQVVIPTVPNLLTYIQRVTKPWPVPVIIVEGDEEKYDAFAASRAALTCSGTVAIELAMARLPAVVAYKVGTLTGLIGRLLIKAKYANLVNIMHDRMIVPELLQDKATPILLANELDKLLGQESVRQEQISCLGDVAAWLGQGKFVPSERAARAILDVVNSRKRRPTS